MFELLFSNLKKIFLVSGKKGKIMERRILKDFHIGIVEGIVSETVTSLKEPKDVFSQIAKVIGRRTSSKHKRKDWNALVRQNTIAKDPIGTAQEAEMAKVKRQSLRKHILTNIHSRENIDQDKLIGSYFGKYFNNLVLIIFFLLFNRI